jgi:anthranilate phosphoribosyltransferase
LCIPIASVLETLGVRRGMVVSGIIVIDGQEERSLDELSTLGNNYVAEFSEAGTLFPTVSPQHFPIQPATLSDLLGADRQTNAEIVRRILHGEERGPKRDAVLLNCAAALYVAGKCASWLEGWQRAAELIDSGKAGAKLQELIGASAGLTV